ncbi:hypothetical protein F511_20478 [Dorcoceras hygrometricum]|uniref:Uncharacterized protein n=1 Tax=Dorcoceras hygrometricum TaxID=472368 RepID=A0A2Z7BLN7_9LAMI|nr:hypothetical protein F511_20478 [Dorcoceras hygrometricum]
MIRKGGCVGLDSPLADMRGYPMLSEGIVVCKSLARVRVLDLIHLNAAQLLMTSRLLKYSISLDDVSRLLKSSVSLDDVTIAEIFNSLIFCETLNDVTTSEIFNTLG